MKVKAKNIGANLIVIPTCNYITWKLVDCFIKDDFSKIKKVKSIYKDQDNLIWINSKYFKFKKIKGFGIHNVCYYGRWYSVENTGYQTINDEIWNCIKIYPLDQYYGLKESLIPEIINCKKDDKENTVCFFC